MEKRRSSNDQNFQFNTDVKKYLTNKDAENQRQRAGRPEETDSSDKAAETIGQLFDIFYQENFEDILIYSEDQMLDKISKDVLDNLLKIYTQRTLAQGEFKELIQASEEIIKKKYREHFDLLNSAWSEFSKIRYKNTNDLYLNNFRKHCSYTGNIPYHMCKFRKGQTAGSRLIAVRENYKITFVICSGCRKCFTSEIMTLYCNHCREVYHSSVLKPSENKDLLPATLSKYHCTRIINEKLKMFDALSEQELIDSLQCFVIKHSKGYLLFVFHNKYNEI